MGQPEDDELLSRTCSEPAVFALFYRRHERPVPSYLRRRTGDSELAADLAAGTFAAALSAARRCYSDGHATAATIGGSARCGGAG